jgi:hypothetical protein
MEKKVGKYLFIGNINSAFGPGFRYADAFCKMKLKAYEKDEIGRGVAALFVAKNGEIMRIKANGHPY